LYARLINPVQGNGGLNATYFGHLRTDFLKTGLSVALVM
jgi:hypothetical protein